MKKIMAFLRRYVCNIEGKLSWRRLGILLITLSGAVLAVQASTPELHLPVQLIIGAKACVALGIYFGLAGLQDAADRKNGIK